MTSLTKNYSLIVTLTLTGVLDDETAFRGNYDIRVVFKGGSGCGKASLIR